MFLAVLILWPQLHGFAIAEADSGSVADALSPYSEWQYRRLAVELDRYRRIADEGGWPQLGGGTTLRRGDQGPGVAILQRRLQVEGELDSGRTPDGFFDQATEQAVRNFQNRRGLEEDGVVGRMTRAALDVSPETRAQTIEINLERWRELTLSPEKRSILVNVAGFWLQALEEGRPVLEMRVIVGKPGSPTPLFDDTATGVVVYPYWNVPPRIVRNELLPSIRKDPGYLAEKQIKVFEGSREIDPASVDWSGVQGGDRYRFRQEPGSQNSLGTIMLSLAQHPDIHLHDTPARSLFARPARALSHGCIRVEKPAALAEFLLRPNPGWDDRRLSAMLDQGKQVSIPASQPVPVHTAYFTAWAGQDGTAQFRADIYGRDKPVQLRARSLESQPDPGPGISGLCR